MKLSRCYIASKFYCTEYYKTFGQKVYRFIFLFAFLKMLYNLYKYVNIFIPSFQEEQIILYFKTPSKLNMAPKLNMVYFYSLKIKEWS